MSTTTEEIYAAIACAVQTVLQETPGGEKRKDVCPDTVWELQRQLLAHPNALAVAIARGFSDYFKYKAINQRIDERQHKV